MIAEKVQILDEGQTLQKIKRIAYEILENNLKEKELVLAGIEEQGYVLAMMLQNELASISDLKTQLIRLKLDKLSPQQSDIQLDVDIKSLRKKTVIIVDDVLNTGKTLAYSLKPFLNIEIKKLQTAVVVDRGYKLFPISADYVGLTLATGLQESVHVELSNAKELGVYLH